MIDMPFEARRLGKVVQVVIEIRNRVEKEKRTEEFGDDVSRERRGKAEKLDWKVKTRTMHSHGESNRTRREDEKTEGYRRTMKND